MNFLFLSESRVHIVAMMFFSKLDHARGSDSRSV